MLAAQVLFTGPQEESKVVVVPLKKTIAVSSKQKRMAEKESERSLLLFLRRRSSCALRKEWLREGEMNKKAQRAKQQLRQKREAEKKRKRKQGRKKSRVRGSRFFSFFLVRDDRGPFRLDLACPPPLLSFLSTARPRSYLTKRRKTLSL